MPSETFPNSDTVAIDTLNPTATATQAHLAACRCNVGATSAGGYAAQRAVASATAAAAGRRSASPIGGGCTVAAATLGTIATALGTISGSGPIAAFGTITRAGAVATFGTIGGTGAIAGPVATTIPPTISCAIARPISRTRTIAVGLQHLLTVAAAIIHPVARARPRVVAKTVGDILVGIFDALAMRGVMLPVVADVVCPVELIDVDVAAGPVEAAAPVIAPAPDSPAGAKCEARGHDAGADV